MVLSLACRAQDGLSAEWAGMIYAQNSTGAIAPVNFTNVVLANALLGDSFYFGNTNAGGKLKDSYGTNDLIVPAGTVFGLAPLITNLSSSFSLDGNAAHFLSSGSSNSFPMDTNSYYTFEVMIKPNNSGAVGTAGNLMTRVGPTAQWKIFTISSPNGSYAGGGTNSGLKSPNNSTVSLSGNVMPGAFIENPGGQWYSTMTDLNATNGATNFITIEVWPNTNLNESLNGGVVMKSWMNGMPGQPTRGYNGLLSALTLGTFTNFFFAGNNCTIGYFAVYQHLLSDAQVYTDAMAAQGLAMDTSKYYYNAFNPVDFAGNRVTLHNQDIHFYNGMVYIYGIPCVGSNSPGPFPPNFDINGNTTIVGYTNATLSQTGMHPLGSLISGTNGLLIANFYGNINPSVAYNAASNYWVMLSQQYSSSGSGYMFSVATNPAGPFWVSNSLVRPPYASSTVGDAHMWPTTNGVTLLAYNTLGGGGGESNYLAVLNSAGTLTNNGPIGNPPGQNREGTFVMQVTNINTMSNLFVFCGVQEYYDRFLMGSFTSPQIEYQWSDGLGTNQPTHFSNLIPLTLNVFGTGLLGQPRSGFVSNGIYYIVVDSWENGILGQSTTSIYQLSFSGTTVTAITAQVMLLPQVPF